MLSASPLLFLIVVLSACSARRPVSVEDASTSVLLIGDGAIILPDGRPPDGPDVCGMRARPLELVTDERRDLRVIVPSGVSATRARAVVAPALAAIALDAKEVAAVALLRQTDQTEPDAILLSLQRALQAEEREWSLSVRATGVGGVSAEGFSDAKEALWEVESTNPFDLKRLRNRLAESMAGARLEGMPGAGKGSAKRFLLRISVAVRPGGVASVAAALTSVLDPKERPSLHDDLGNGTHLTTRRHVLTPTCNRGPLETDGKADIVWIVDESYSMDNNRESIVAHAGIFFEQATAAGLDFRMGVAGMRDPGAGSVEVGKLCSRASDDPEDDGGDDRFLDPTERAAFFGCVRNPPYKELQREFGLTAAYEVVSRHLPRAAGRSDRFREGATIALIFVTDEAPHELKAGTQYAGREGFLDPPELGSTWCTISDKRRREIDDYLAPWVDLFESCRGDEGGILVHAVGGVCGNACHAQTPYGYGELTRRFGGLVGDVCRADIRPTLTAIIDSIVAASAAFPLKGRPVSASLRVSISGLELPRSVSRGFAYRAGANSVSFANVRVSRGAQVVVSFRRVFHER